MCLGKRDNCYELNLLRNFRDNYLFSLNEGKKLIKEYYEIAPKIVKNINKLKNAKQIYISLYKNYIKPCIKNIGLKNYNKTLNIYKTMMEELKRKFCKKDKLKWHEDF